MTNQEFCYWLQGYFELSDDDAAPLTDTQVDLIGRHIELCAATGTPGASMLAIKVLLPHASGSDYVTSAVRQLLADVFEHIIDPKDGDDSALLGPRP